MITILRLAALAVLPITMLAAGAPAQAHMMKHHRHHYHGKMHHRGHGHWKKCVPNPHRKCHNGGDHKAP